MVRTAHFPRGWSSAQCPAQQWLHVPVLFLEAFGRISNISFVLVYSDPAIDSRPALRGVLSLSFFKARFEELNMDYFVLQNGVVCTVDYSAEFLPSFCTWEIGHYFISPCIRQALFTWFRRVMMCGIFEHLCQTQVPGGAGVAGNFTPR